MKLSPKKNKVPEKNFKTPLYQYDEIYVCILSKGIDVNTSVKKSPIKQIEQVLQKLHFQNNFGYRDTTRWRMARFNDICSDNMQHFCSEESNESDIDNMLGHDVARNALKHLS